MMRRCAECGWAPVLVAGSGLGLQPAPDVVLIPPLLSGTGMTAEAIEPGDRDRVEPVVFEAQKPDPAVCEWCGDPEFDFVTRPDGFFRRCLRCRGIHRW